MGEKRVSRGFTLIELLVVIAIIAILAAILFPVFARARSKARQTQCVSNVKQLCLGMNMYAQDYDETYPQWQWGVSYVGGSGAGILKNNGTSIWFNAIYPYVKNNQMYQCPDSNYLAKPMTDGFFGWFSTSGDCTTWANATRINPAFCNNWVSYGVSEVMADSYPRMNMFARPAQSLLVSDMHTPSSSWDYYDWNVPDNPEAPNSNIRLRRIAYPNGFNQSWFWGAQDQTGPFDPIWSDYARHTQTNAIGYMDGHVKSVNAAKCVNALIAVNYH